MTAGEAALLVAAGLAAGVVNAVAGGGTLVTFPALLAAGLSPVAANVTNTVAVWPGYLSGAAAYRREPRRAGVLPLAAAATAGAAVGTALLLTTPVRYFDAVVPYLVLGATALLAAQPWLSDRLAGAAPAARRRAPLVAAAFVAAVYGAYFGGGLGIVLLAILALGTGDDLPRLNGLKILLSLLINTVALVGFAAFGPVDWWAAATIAPASLAGGLLGGRLAQRLRPTALRVAVVVFGAAVGVVLLVR
ncbi:MAG TPA: sulfite exporter TauE/SafE family protein [Pilimelia sp.]|nr:sulfite exporter TauE/SafE family protein [Pilimelia sp.]